MSRLTRIGLSVVTAAVLAAGVIGSAALQPELEVLTHNLTSGVVKNEANEDDWSYVYTVQARNRGQAGNVRVKGRITTPQGQFYREMVVRFAQDEMKVLRFVYTEPNFLAEILTPEAQSKYEFSYEIVQ